MSDTNKRQNNNADLKSTACILCELNCGIKVRTDGSHISKIIGDKAHPVSEGYVCEKTQRLDYYQNSPDRLTSPMRRRDDGSYEAIDWDTAIREVAEKFTQVRDQFGGERILYYGGGGQGNHLGGGYANSWLKALGVRYRSSALAQEKTGEFWVSGAMLGTMGRGDFEHAQVSMMIGKNPWQSHGIARARAVIREIEKDPERSLIVIDPRVSETAEKADYHLQVKPGTDAWCLSALVAILVQENLIDRAWIDRHTSGYKAIEAGFSPINVGSYARRCGVEEGILREVASVIAKAESFSTYEDLGIQMSVHSTLNSWLQRLLWLTTGHFARKGCYSPFVPLVPLVRVNAKERRSPVLKERVITGLIPCNIMADEILADHPDAYRAMIVDSGNPVHSVADIQRLRDAMRHLDVSVVIDVAMTETAREADYVLPASSQYEKVEATFFNFETPRNTFHLRHPIFPPLKGTLPEAEIHARLLEALAIPELLQELATIDALPSIDAEFPFVLSAGERRSETTNTIVRDTAWHKKGVYASLAMSPADADKLGCNTGSQVRVITPRGSGIAEITVSERMQPGHVSLPNGAGLSIRGDDDQYVTKGLAPNELTDAQWRDPIAGTPWHKHVPARVERL